MTFFYFDASALCKRYVTEVGTPLVNYLFSNITPDRMMCLMIGIGEVISIFVRKRNDGRITASVFTQAIADFQAEVINAPDFECIMTDSIQVMKSWELIEKHSLNATDAIVLRSALDYVSKLKKNGDDLVMVAADSRLIRSAKAEGMNTFNPETDSLETLKTLLISS